MDRSFDLHGDPERPASPVVLSVPHAGRAYPPEIVPLIRWNPSSLRALEDRYVDLVALGARGPRVALVQKVPRAWIDLNRGEDERDPLVDEGADPRRQPARSAKLRSGLGLVPRRVPGAGEIWRRKLTPADMARRIERAHRPYHQALAHALAAAHARFGVAVLLDLHSMPPLGAGGAQVVLGDRFGRAAAARFVGRAEGVALAARLRVALNSPYAGGHVLDRHGRPERDVHAIQLELDRSLYLDGKLDAPGDGLAATAALVGSVIAALEDEALSAALPLAAE
ncbi:N-formylglutamate amidohydrolase [Sphingomonas lenta]|uniref:N-formylglutamate amidohydrolase n=1 Tax=Sphingomonas lenta TaxID=1141887 RepID=A0A2A2SBX5_9SPHN|nr:N-formylglutamate amidohydrolase [Sphingomonas lenta]PAX06501.1 N-formylglutamate amidohydrolase [Sphingomonas lenta]